MARFSIGTRLKALVEAHQAVAIKTECWLQAPSKERRADLEEALADHEDVVTKILGLDDDAK
jgi:hypothetical protein